MSTSKTARKGDADKVNEPPSSESRANTDNGQISESQRIILNVVGSIGQELVLALSGMATQAGNEQRWGDMNRYLSCANDLSSAYSQAYVPNAMAAQAAGGAR